jgi:hypothetical protein
MIELSQLCTMTIVLPKLSQLRIHVWVLAGAYLGFCQGGCTFLADLPPPPPRIWIRIRIKILSWIRIRIKTMWIHSPGLNCLIYNYV